MAQPAELFRAYIASPEADERVFDLRSKLTRAKREALAQVEGLDEAGLKLVMPGLYEQIVVTGVQMAAHVGLGVAIALSMFDEHTDGTSISGFGREARQQMADMSAALKGRQSSRLAKLVAEIESQRLAWRHSHEFLSWLAFRRTDPQYPAQHRIERLEAFKLDARLLHTRTRMIELLGPKLSAAVEGADRFHLANRWRLSVSPEHTLEALAWQLMSYQPGPTVSMERARAEHDALAESGAPKDRLAASHHRMRDCLHAQLVDALGDLPAVAQSGV